MPLVSSLFYSSVRCLCQNISKADDENSKGGGGSRKELDGTDLPSVEPVPNFR